MKTISLLIFMAILSTSLLKMPVYAHETGNFDLEVELWHRYVDTIAQPCQFLAEDAYSSIYAHYKFRKEDAGKILELCKCKEKIKYVYNYHYKTNLGKRYLVKDSIESDYLDSINVYLIPYNPELSGRYISYVFRIAEKMKLSDKTCQTLMKQAIDMARQLRRNPKLDLKMQEMKALKQLLSYRQCEQIIYSTNDMDVKKRVDSIWKRLSDSQLVEAKDSISQTTTIYKYLQRELFVKDYYIDDKELLQNNLHDLYTHKPMVIDMFEGLAKKRAVKQNHEQKVGKEFAW